MALKFLTTHTPGGSSTRDVKVFEIRLENDYIVFRGGEDEAASASLSGSLVLCLADAMMVQHVKLTLSGIVHMSYLSANTSTMTGKRLVAREDTFYEKTWTFRDAGRGRSDLLPSDNYEWRFDTVLDGTMPESVEGCKEAWVMYRLKAEICRKRGKDIVTRKPLRIVRTLGATALELSHAMSVENIWPNKVEYSISTPSKAVIFGSFLQVDFKLISLLKGLVIGSVTTQLKEEQEFMVDPEWGVLAYNGGLIKEDRIICWDNYTVKDADEQILDEQAEGYQFSRYLELPKSLNRCLQDCNVKGIKVRHRIKFNVQLHNPDGHVSELRANLPVSLYISPNLPLNENNDLVDQTPQASRAAIENDLAHAAPPVYGQHTLDQLFSDVDRSGYMTPGAALSGPSTPYTHSRNISSENLASLDAVTSSPNHVSAAALQSRLQNLRGFDRLGTSPLAHDELDQWRSSQPVRSDSQQATSDYFAPVGGQQDSGYVGRMGTTTPGGHFVGANSSHSSRSGSAQISRRSSAANSSHTPSGTRSPFLLTDQYDSLVKVPSYSTAVRTPFSQSYSSDQGLPTYGAVLSESQPGTPAEPPSAHLSSSRSGIWGEDAGNVASAANTSGFGSSRSASQSRVSNMPESRRRTVAGHS